MTERKDKLKNKAKVVKEVLKNPLATQDDIAKKIGVGKSTVNRNLQELAQNGTKDTNILGICDEDFKIIKLTQKETIRRIEEEPEVVSTSDLIRAGAESTKRYTLFKGDITDDKGGMKDISALSSLNNLLND